MVLTTFAFDFDLLYSENGMEDAVGEGYIRKINEDWLFCGEAQILS